MTKEFLRSFGIEFEERDITKDSSALEELRALGVMATPVMRLGDQVVIGFDEEKLKSLLGLGS